MQELEKILEEIEKSAVYIESEYGDRDTFVSVEAVERIIRKHMSGKDINVPTNDGWIPVEDRLPEAGERVVATIKHHAWISDYDQNWVPESEKTMYQEYMESCEAVMTENGIWSYRCKEDDYDIDTASVHPGKSLNYPIAEVIAWRPLPEPYRQRAEHERLTEIGEALLEGIGDSKREMEAILNEEN